MQHLWYSYHLHDRATKGNPPSEPNGPKVHPDNIVGDVGLPFDVNLLDRDALIRRIHKEGDDDGTDGAFVSQDPVMPTSPPVGVTLVPPRAEKKELVGAGK